MNYLRELLYRPKKSDRSLTARFFFADEALTAVAAELDSFDGRKDPERCASLVNRLRNCQDKLLGICMKILEVLEPGTTTRSREFRAKFPDDIMTDNLAGQLWFGAECLAAGSSIMNKESESEAMRPLAKAVTKSLDKVRTLLREQCLSPTPHEFTENIRENLKIFDRLFADFEYNYVRCMVHVKTLKEYDLHQDLIVLFSETLARSIKQDMVSQDLVDNYDPSLMFAIPRLAIVYGLLVCPDGGPLSVDRSHGDYPSLFLPFKNLLRKIRELLQTLEPSEVMVLEMLLCQLEEPANITTKLKEVEVILANKAKTEALQAGLNGDQESGSSRKDRISTIPCQCDAGSGNIVSMARSIVDDLVNAAVDRVAKPMIGRVEIDCTGPEIKVSPHRRQKGTGPGKEPVAIGGGVPVPSHHHRGGPSSLKRHNACRDIKRIPYRYRKDRRARFKSTEDLIHRLYVCISGAADQLQSNYAADFRSILRVVFLINVTSDEVTDSPTAAEDGEDVQAPHLNVNEPQLDDCPPHSTPQTAAFDQVDLATDALQHEISSSLINTQLRSEDGDPARDAYYEDEDADSSGNSGPGGVYAQNLDLHMHSSEEVVTREPTPTEFYQPEPTLLDIADGATTGSAEPSSPQETTVADTEFVSPRRSAPPAWVPDADAPACMGCREPFTFVRRRHHCRACGKVFCNRCSSHYEPLPHFGLDRPVRVCNRCHLLLQPDPGFYLGASPSLSTSSPSSSDGMDPVRSPSVDTRSPSWGRRNYGMVS